MAFRRLWKDPIDLTRPALTFMLIAMGASPVAQAATIPQADVPKFCMNAPDAKADWLDFADGDTCRIVRFGLIANATPPIFYQMQSYLSAGQTPEVEELNGNVIVGGALNDGAGLVLLTPAPDGAALIPLRGWSGGGAVITVPRIVNTLQGPILVIPMSADVSSNPNDDAVMRYVGRTWTELTDDWYQHINLPPGVEQRKGNAMDWVTLRAFGALWRHGDAECCPTGGSYIAQLRLDGSHLRLASVRYSSGDMPFP